MGVGFDPVGVVPPAVGRTGVGTSSLGEAGSAPLAHAATTAISMAAPKIAARPFILLISCPSLFVYFTVIRAVLSGSLPVMTRDDVRR
jgi:hypothetical protein